jgi:hypothetical protein
MNLNLKFYIEMKYDQKNMCDFFKKKLWTLLVHVHDITMCTQDTPLQIFMPYLRLNMLKQLFIL